MKSKDKARLTAVKNSVDNGSNEIIIREGQAETIRERIVISLTGTINAISEFWNKRKHKEENAHIIYSKESMQIKLVVNENSYFKKTITGILEINPELAKFNINEDVKLSVKELTDLLKMNKFFFASREQAGKIITHLQKFKLSAQTQIEQFDEGRGNKKDMVEIKVDSNLDLSFELKLPVYKGQPDRKFKVEVNFDVRDAQVEIWLESEELRIIELKDLEDIFEKELKPFKESGIVCIEQ